MKKALSAGLLFLGVIVVSGCATMDYVTGRKVNNLFSLDDDIRMGNDVYSDMMKELRSGNCAIDKDQKKVKEIREITERLAGISHAPEIPFSVTLAQTNIVNAFALPGGKIVVFEGLYDPKEGLVKDRDELAAVLAHEVAHVVCRHSTEELTRSLPIDLILLGGAIYAEHKNDEDMQLIFGGAFVLKQGLWVTKYSRKNEKEADRVGLEYMARAGYNPEAAVRLWKRAYEQGGGTPKVLSILSTHPRNEDRYKDLQSRLPLVMPIYARTKGGRLEPAPRMLPSDKVGTAGAVK